jgi:carbonic anhydrase
MRVFYLFFTMLWLCIANAAAAPVAKWSYDGMNDGQDMWGSLSQEYALCDIGTMQSPVVISHTEKAEMPALSFQYSSGNATLLRTQTGLSIVPKQANLLKVGTEEFKLELIVFHSPSEHVILDQFFTLEVQLLHKHPDGRQLILAVLVEPSGLNQGLTALTSLETVMFDKPMEVTLDPATFLPSSFGHYAYTGSLTTPPCTEGVEWRVLKKPLSMSYAQINFFINLIGRNARLEQPIYSRTVRETTY